MFRKFAEKNIVVFDGGMGTTIQNESIPEALWGDFYGCNEYLNISAPEIMKNIHRKYFQAGADVAETNTFGATRLILSEYGLEDQVYEINVAGAKLARGAADEFSDKFVFGSMGPGTKLPSLSQISFDDLYEMYKEQSKGLMDGGVDGLIVETSQDLLQIKSALKAIFDNLEELKIDLPVCVSITVESTGTMLVGSDISAAAALIGSYPVFSLGLNCGLGPDMMHKPLSELTKYWNRSVSCIPNAGLPENVNGKTVYTMTPGKMAEIFKGLLDELPLNIIGGCCGTGYEHIKQLKNIAKSINPSKPSGTAAGLSSSLYTSTSLTQTPPPAIIGERANANGSKAFRELLLNNDYEGMLNVAKEQEDAGAHFIDVCVAYAGRDEMFDMQHFVSLLNKTLSAPIVIDSTEPPVIETALKNYSGKPIINSINLEDGGGKLHKILKLVHDYPANVIALTIDENGMAMTADEKFKIAEKIYNIWTKQYNLAPEGLIFDPLTFSIGSGDTSLKFAAVETLNAIKMIKDRLKGAKTVLGVSNVSFGLSKESRVFLNAVFLEEAVKNGLDMAIVHASKLINLSSMDKHEINLCKNLIYGRENALNEFISHFSGKSLQREEEVEEDITEEKALVKKLQKGDKKDLEKVIDTLLQKYKPFEIINDILMPGMKEIGELFGSGKMLLPFVLQSAEVMKKSVTYLEKFINKEDTETKGKVILATVKGDVHDIGKNLVEIILSNNGYEVYNLGIKVSVDEMIERAKEVKADAIGMSGLLVKSTGIMKENIAEIAQRQLDTTVLLGGAALTEGFVKNECEPLLKGKVHYCADAFSALKYLKIKPSQRRKISGKPQINQVKSDTTGDEQIRNDLSTDDIPIPPFWGSKIEENIDINDALKFMNRQTLYKTRWGYKKSSVSTEAEYIELLKNEADSEYNEILLKLNNEIKINPKVSYGYFKCQSSDETLNIYDADEKLLADVVFPRSSKPPFLSIPDYFKDIQSATFDVLPLQIVTLGSEPAEYTKQLKENHRYKKYFLLHGFFTELTEALAEFWHKRIREELKIDNKDADSIDGILNGKYRGLRYSFGYPSCPDLYGNKIIGDLLSMEKININLTETYQMVPEFSTSALIAHNPKAEYFTL
ncbi:methionine synthase [Flexistipes sinusarabici]|uniref:methionine synthase n=1 Tax=Flexistipes sinusarabici TaxID=2352 RepID=UPI002354BA8F|nr:methionine synthase [Flexistipes sinusarabici]